MVLAFGGGERKKKMPLFGAKDPLHFFFAYPHVKREEDYLWLYEVQRYTYVSFTSTWVRSDVVTAAVMCVSRASSCRRWVMPSSCQCQQVIKFPFDKSIFPKRTRCDSRRDWICRRRRTQIHSTLAKPFSRIASLIWTYDWTLKIFTIFNFHSMGDPKTAEVA